MIGNFFQFGWEIELIKWCQNYIPGFIIEILSVVSNIGDTFFIVPVICFFYLCYDKKIGKKIIYNTLMGLVLSGSIKNIFKRRRPYFDNADIECLKIVDKKYDKYDAVRQGFSFPSMHSTNIVVVTGSIYNSFKKKPLLYLSIIVSFIVGISRFVLGCHYPTDVLAGWLLGLFVIAISSKVQSKLSDNYQYLLLLAIGTISLFFSTSNDYLSSFGITIGFVCCELFDKKYCDFKNTNNVFRIIARLVFALGVFLSINLFMEYVIFTELRESVSLIANIYRVFRYALSAFVAIGLTPLLYKYNLLKIKDDKE